MTTYNTISLALQGGGTYGAFGWGVLDRLLQREDFILDALSGSSAGAFNAVVVADGYARGGGREARDVRSTNSGARSAALPP